MRQKERNTVCLLLQIIAQGRVCGGWGESLSTTVSPLSWYDRGISPSSLNSSLLLFGPIMLISVERMSPEMLDYNFLLISLFTKGLGFRRSKEARERWKQAQPEHKTRGRDKECREGGNREEEKSQRMQQNSKNPVSKLQFNSTLPPQKNTQTVCFRTDVNSRWTDYINQSHKNKKLK